MLARHAAHLQRRLASGRVAQRVDDDLVEPPDGIRPAFAHGVPEERLELLVRRTLEPRRRARPERDQGPQTGHPRGDRLVGLDHFGDDPAHEPRCDDAGERAVRQLLEPPLKRGREPEDSGEQRLHLGSVDHVAWQEGLIGAVEEHRGGQLDDADGAAAAGDGAKQVDRGLRHRVPVEQVDELVLREALEQRDESLRRGLCQPVVVQQAQVVGHLGVEQALCQGLGS